MPKVSLLVGSESPLDLELKQQMKTIDVHCVPKKWNYFISVFGDFVIYNYMDKKIWKEVDTLFKNKDIKTAREEIQFLSQKKGSYKIVVERNPQKVSVIKREFEKYFILKKRQSVS